MPNIEPSDFDSSQEISRVFAFCQKEFANAVSQLRSKNHQFNVKMSTNQSPRSEIQICISDGAMTVSFVCIWLDIGSGGGKRISFGHNCGYIPFYPKSSKKVVGSAFVVFDQNTNTANLSLRYYDNSLRGTISSTLIGKRQFFDRLWDKIIKDIERYCTPQRSTSSSSYSFW